jgi:DNA-binding LytR/AlgR family response regulator
MNHSYIIIDDNQESILETQAVAAKFQNLHPVGTAMTYEEGLDLILEHNPQLVFLEIDPENQESKLSLGLLNELHRYLKVLPQIIITTRDKALAFEAIQYDVLDYYIKPLAVSQLRKSVLKFEKTLEGAQQFPVMAAENREPVSLDGIHTTPAPVIETPVIVDVPEMKTEEVLLEEALDPKQYELQDVTEKLPDFPTANKEEKPLIICVKSYGDYRFIEAKDICYLQADNNSTDIHLYNGEMITAFKTLKHFEGVLSSPFVRIHNSYIVNIDYVSRIHTGNAVCYIKNTTTKLPFSKSYKDNVDSIINSITNGNYLEI